MNITIKKMETDDEIEGKAYVHWKSWQEAYHGLIDQRYLDGLSLEKYESNAYRMLDNIAIAKDGDAVVGFVSYGKYRKEDLENTGEVFAIYVLFRSILWTWCGIFSDAEGSLAIGGLS